MLNRVSGHIIWTSEINQLFKCIHVQISPIWKLLQICLGRLNFSLDFVILLCFGSQWFWRTLTLRKRLPQSAALSWGSLWGEQLLSLHRLKYETAERIYNKKKYVKPFVFLYPVVKQSWGEAELKHSGSTLSYRLCLSGSPAGFEYVCWCVWLSVNSCEYLAVVSSLRRGGAAVFGWDLNLVGHDAPAVQHLGAGSL